MQYIYLCNAAILSFRMKNIGNLNRDRKTARKYRQPQNNRYFVAYLIFFRKFAAQNKMM